MSYLVKQNLLDLIPIAPLNQVLAQGDSSVAIVAEPGPADRAIKTKRVVSYAMALKQLIGQGGNFLNHDAQTMGLQVSF